MTTRAPRSALLIGILLLAQPLSAQCNSAIQMSYGTDAATLSAINGTIYEVVVDLGFFSGTFPAIINRVSAEFACPPTAARFGCPELLGVFTYEGDATITTDCPTYWTTGHFALPYPGDVTFEANPPLEFTQPITAADWAPGAAAVAGRHCQLRYRERLIGGVPGASYRQVLGLRYHGEDALCADGSPAGNIDTNLIRMAP